mgnify:CR=1 FL=1
MINFSHEDELYSFNEKSRQFFPEQKKLITGIESGVLLLLSEIERSQKIIFSIKTREFKELITYVFKKNGFEAQLTMKTRDGGRDFIALKQDLRIPV